MNDLETMLRERLRVADDVCVPLDPDAALAAGRRARRLRTVRWVVAGVAAVLVAVAIVALVLGAVAGARDGGDSGSAGVADGDADTERQSVGCGVRHRARSPPMRCRRRPAASGCASSTGMASTR